MAATKRKEATHSAKDNATSKTKRQKVTNHKSAVPEPVADQDSSDEDGLDGFSRTISSEDGDDAEAAAAAYSSPDEDEKPAKVKSKKIEGPTDKAPADSAAKVKSQW